MVGIGDHLCIASLAFGNLFKDHIEVVPRVQGAMTSLSFSSPWVHVHLYRWDLEVPVWVQDSAAKNSLARIKAYCSLAMSWKEVNARVPQLVYQQAMMTYVCYLWLTDDDACGGPYTRAASIPARHPNKYAEDDCVGWPAGNTESLAPYILE